MDSRKNEDIDCDDELENLSCPEVKSLFQLSLENVVKSLAFRGSKIYQIVWSDTLEMELVRKEVDVSNMVEGVSTSRALHIASAYGFLKLVQFLLKIGTKIKLDGNIIGPLVIASQNGHIEVVSELLKFGADIDLDIDAGEPLTSLQTAARNGHESVVKILLEHGAEVDKNDDMYNETALGFAAERGSLPIVKLLLSHGAYVNGPFPIDKLKENHYFPEKLDYKEAYEELQGMDPDEFLSVRMPLHAACEKGHLEIVRELLKHGAFLDGGCYAYEGDNLTPLGLAIKCGHEEIVNELLKHKPNLVEVVGWGTKSPLWVATNIGDLKMVKKLIAHGANVSGPWETIDLIDSAFYEAYSNRNYEIMSLLLKKGANVDENGTWFPDTTLFQDAAMESLTGEGLEMFYYLLLKGANINAQDKNGKTALHRTAERKLVRNVNKLLDHGADPYVQDNEKNTALHRAVIEYQKYHNDNHGVKVIEELLDDVKGMKNVSHRNADGETALEIALRKCTEGSNKAKRKYYFTVAQKIAKVACPKPKISDPIYPLKFLL